MTRILWLALGLLLGYAARRPVCEREHRLPRHRDPAIVRQPPESDEGIQPPDPRTWLSPPVTLAETATVTHTGRTWTGTWPTLSVTSEPAVVTTVPDPRTWPDMLDHEGTHVPLLWAAGCPRCEADAWAEVETALPFGGITLRKREEKWSEPGEEYMAAHRSDGRDWDEVYAPTPAAALRALAAKLREVGR